MTGKSMLDADFDIEEEVGGEEEIELEDVRDNKPEKEEDGLEVEVVDDTPDADKGKWVADEKSADDPDKEEDKQQYGKSVRERIAKETAKVHAERRAKEERERQLNEATGLLRKLIKENNDLKGLVENGEKVLVSEHQGRLESQLASAKHAYKQALEAGDTEGQILAQENLAKVAAQMDRLTTHRVNPIPRMDEKEVDKIYGQPQQQRQEPDREALEWQDKNRWFMRDETMTAYAMAYHNRLVQQEGITPADGKKYWNAVDKEMRTRFPERFRTQSAAPRRTDTIVAPATREGSGKVARKVTLTESQVRLAKRLGLTPQQYAEQVVAERDSKEWTHG